MIAIGKAIRDLMDGFRGTVDGVKFMSTAVEDDRDLYDSTSKLARANFDLMIAHDE